MLLVLRWLNKVMALLLDNEYHITVSVTLVRSDGSFVTYCDFG